jgi:hypothetical protein
MSDMQAVETLFGLVCVEEVPVGQLAVDDVVAYEDPERPGEGGYLLLRRVQHANGRLGLYCMHPARREVSAAPYEVLAAVGGDFAWRVVATAYDNHDGCREVLHPGQIRYGGMFVCVLRDAAHQLPPMNDDPDDIYEVFNYAIANGLVDDYAGESFGIPDAGWELLQRLDEIYPAYWDDVEHWRFDDLQRTVAL